MSHLRKADVQAKRRAAIQALSDDPEVKRQKAQVDTQLFGESGDFTQSPTNAMRKKCLDCCGGDVKYIKFCTLDGVHGDACQLWPFRFGMTPAAAARKHGERFVTPEQMPGGDVPLEDCK